MFKTPKSKPLHLSRRIVAYILSTYMWSPNCLNGSALKPQSMHYGWIEFISFVLQISDPWSYNHGHKLSRMSGKKPDISGCDERDTLLTIGVACIPDEFIPRAFDCTFISNSALGSGRPLFEWVMEVHDWLCHHHSYQFVQLSLVEYTIHFAWI